MWANDFFTTLYDNLEDAVEQGADFIGDAVDMAADSVDYVVDKATAPVKWIWETLQGDFNDDMTMGQIIANTVLGLIPIVDQILDIRDLIANAKMIHKDSSNKMAWITLCLTLIGLIPSLGSAIKGVFKILFLFIKKTGGDVAVAVNRAMKPIIGFLSDKKVMKLLDGASHVEILKQVVDKVKDLKGMLNKGEILALLAKAVDALRDTIKKVEKLAPGDVKLWLHEALELVESIQKQADKMLEPVMKPLQEMLDEIAESLQKQIDEAGENVTTRAKNITQERTTKGIPRIVKGSLTAESLEEIVRRDATEIIEDPYIVAQGSKKKAANLLKELAATARAQIARLDIGPTKNYENLSKQIIDLGDVNPFIKELDKLDRNGMKTFYSIPTENIDSVKDVIKTAYSNAGIDMHPVLEGMIENHLKKGLFSHFDGVPGTHAEVLALNEILHELTKKGIDPKTFDYSEIDMATFKLGKSNKEYIQGEHFGACNNCSGIIPSTVNIITGKASPLE